MVHDVVTLYLSCSGFVHETDRVYIPAAEKLKMVSFLLFFFFFFFFASVLGRDFPAECRSWEELTELKVIFRSHM